MSQSQLVTLFELARGGLGRVDLCVKRDGAFERLCAVKRMHPHLVMDPAFRQMFLDEGRIAALLRHANVISVVDRGQDSEGPYLVMDYVEGVSLKRLMETLEVDELLPVEICVTIGAQIARGLSAAHSLCSNDGRSLELIHRDVSPHNILLGYDGVVRVLDFGIAKSLGRQTESTTGLLKGKVGYFSPEQIRFEHIDHRSDLFALGVVLYELLAGKRLYQGTAQDVFPRVLGEPPPDLLEERRDVPPVVCGLVFELLAKDRNSRPSTALEVAERLEAIAAEGHASENLGGLLVSMFTNDRGAMAERIRRALSGSKGSTSGDAVAAVTSVTPVDDVDATIVDEPEPFGTDSAMTGPEPRPRFRWAVASLALLLVMAGGLVVGLVSRGDDEARSDSRPAASPPPLATPTLAAPPEHVEPAPVESSDDPEPVADPSPPPADRSPGPIDPSGAVAPRPDHGAPRVRRNRRTMQMVQSAPPDRTNASRDPVGSSPAMRRRIWLD